MALNSDYAKLANQMKMDNANSILGQSGAPSIAGISGDLLQQWAMLGANANAYKKLVEAENAGGVSKPSPYTELLSDRYFNDYYDSETGKLKKATYSPSGAQQPGLEIGEDATSGDVLSDMRALALSAISNPDNLNPNHYDFFEKMRSSIASNLVTKAEDKTTVTAEEAKPAELTKDFDYRLLLDDQSFTVAGGKGEKTYNFTAGTSIGEIAAAIDADSAETGVSAEMIEADDGTLQIKMTSSDTGKEAFVRVDQTKGDLFAGTDKSISATGKDEVKKDADEVASGEDTQAAIAAGLYTGKTFEDVAFTLAGRNGAESFAFGKGATAEEIVAAVNEKSEETGVTAEVIRNADGSAEGIGLLAAKAGDGNSVQVRQEKGSLFAGEGRTVGVSGSSIDKGSSDGPAINSLSDLGKVSVDGVTYSFADLAQGGKASLANNPDAALAVLDQTLRDIADGRAEIKGFDPSGLYVPGLQSGTGRSDSTNALEYGNYGSDAMTNWIGKYMKEEEA